MRWNVPECRHAAQSPCRVQRCRYSLPRAANGERCALTLIEEHPDGMPLELIGERFGLTRERIRQIEGAALVKLASGRRRFSG